MFTIFGIREVLQIRNIAREEKNIGQFSFV